MSAHKRTRSARLQVSSDSDDLPLTDLMKKTPSKNEHTLDDDAGSYSSFRPLMTSTPSVFDSGQIAVRSGSERLKRKRGREFRMPSRKDVFDEIAESPSKSYSHLQPRSLIYNFTKENHRYNYDRASTSGESSICDFIDDDEDDDNDSDSQHSERQPHFTRLTQTKVCRIGTSSSSSSEDEEQKKITQECTHKHRTINSQTEQSDLAKCKAGKNKRRNSALETDSSATDNSEAENVTPTGKRFRGSVLLVTSSDEEASQTGKVVLNESTLVDSGIGSTRFEGGKTNTTADFASIELNNDRVTGDDASCLDDIDSDTGSRMLSGQDSGSVTGKCVASGKDGSSEEEEEGRRGTSERVQTLAGRKEHRRNVIMPCRQERLRRLK